MNKSKLSDHIFKKGKFISPMNKAMGDVLVLTSWAKDRLPEYLWLACILDSFDRTVGLEKAYLILKKLSELDSEINLPTFSNILKLSDNLKTQFFSYIHQILDKNVFYPLTIIFSYSDCPIFSRQFCNPSIDLREREKKLTYLLNETSDHQSNFSTDIRFLIIYFLVIKGKIIFNSALKDSVDMLAEYPYISHDDEKMRTIRPLIRANEGCLQGMTDENNNDFINEFWERVSQMSDCQLSCINWGQEKTNTDDYITIIEPIFKYLSDFLTAEKPLDDKASVLIGISTYSYKRVRELSEYNIANTITARSTIRVLVENYIMIKYLINNEPSKENIWLAFKEYGIGCYKSIVARARDLGEDFPLSHIEPKYIECLVNSFKNEEFLDIDTSYFDKQGIREKAISVNEKELWGRFYDYASSYEHGLWGSILESSMVMCNNPSHQFHFVPDSNNSQKLKSVWSDAVMLMNKTLNYLNGIYEIPPEFLEKANEYEKQLS